MQGLATDYRETGIYQLAFKSARALRQVAWQFPKSEKQLLDKSIGASREVCASIARAWGKQRCQIRFVTELSEVKLYANEVQTWLALAVEYGCMDDEVGEALMANYERIAAQVDALAEM